MAAPLTIKLRCSSWGQLEQIYSRDLTRSAIFLKTQKPPPLGTKLRINLTLPSETLIILAGEVKQHIGAGGLGGRGPGVDIELDAIPQSAMWLIESALAAAKKKQTSAVRMMPSGSTSQATRQSRVPSQSGSGRPSGEATLEDGEKLVDAERQLVAALRTEFESLRKLNAFQLLGVGYDADDQQVRTEFARLTKKYHPDRFARYQSAEARELASEIFILTRDAYRRVGTARARQQTLRALKQQPQTGRASAGSRNTTSNPRQPGAPPSAPRSGASAPRATSPGRGTMTRTSGPATPTPARGATPQTRTRNSPQRPTDPAPSARKTRRPDSSDRPPPTSRPSAESGATRGQTPPAVAQPKPGTAQPTRRASKLSDRDLFGSASNPIPAPPTPLDLNGSRPGASGLDRADALVQAGRHAEALQIYKQSAQRTPGDLRSRAGVELCEGFRALEDQDRLEAAQRFEMVLELDPENEQAARQLADMRRQATQDRKGLLARLLGKKE